MNKFRASFSILSVWEKGDWQRAIKMYFKLDDFMSPAMEFGKNKHAEWETEIKQTNKIPSIFGNIQLKNPQIEQKTVIQLEDWLEFVGVPDCVDLPVIYEFKTGKADSDSYTKSMQGKVYQLLYPTATRVEIHHFDQYKGTVDTSYILLTPKTLEEAKNWVETLASDMHSYFVENQLYEKFGA